MPAPPQTLWVILLTLFTNLGCRKIEPPLPPLPHRILMLDPGVKNVDLQNLILTEAKGIGESIASLDIYLMASTMKDPAPRLIKALSPQVGQAIDGNIRGALRAAMEAANQEAAEAGQRAVAEEIQAQQSRNTPSASPILESLRYLKRRTDTEPGPWELHALTDEMDVVPGAWSWEKARIGAPESIHGWQAYVHRTGGPIAFGDGVTLTFRVPTAISIAGRPLLAGQMDALQAAWQEALQGSKVTFRPIESDQRTPPTPSQRRSKP